MKEMGALSLLVNYPAGRRKEAEILWDCWVLDVVWVVSTERTKRIVKHMVLQIWKICGRAGKKRKKKLHRTILMLQS